MLWSQVDPSLNLGSATSYLCDLDRSLDMSEPSFSSVK